MGLGVPVRCARDWTTEAIMKSLLVCGPNYPVCAMTGFGRIDERPFRRDIATCRRRGPRAGTADRATP
jgi:hypothetical protein